LVSHNHIQHHHRVIIRSLLNVEPESHSSLDPCWVLS